jgi:hypothetical protein
MWTGDVTRTKRPMPRIAQHSGNQPCLIAGRFRRRLLNHPIGRHTGCHEHGAEHFALRLELQIGSRPAARRHDQPGVDQLCDARPLERAQDAWRREGTDHLAAPTVGRRAGAQDDDRFRPTCLLEAFE